MDDFEMEEREESDIIDDVIDVVDSGKDLKKEWKKFKNGKENVKSSTKDGGASFRNSLRSSQGSSSQALSQSVEAGTAQAGNVAASGGVVAEGVGAAEAGIATGEGVSAGAAGSTTVAVEGTAAGGAAAAGGAVAAEGAAGGTAAGGAAAGGAAAGGAAGSTAAGVSATGVGAIVVAAIGLVMALANLAKKVTKKVEELTGQESKHKKWLLLGIILIPLVFIFVGSSLFVVSDTAYTDMDTLIKRREQRYGKSLIMFTDAEYEETISKDFDDDKCYNSIVKGYGSDLTDSFLPGLDTNSILNDDSLSKQEKDEKIQELSSNEVKKYLKAERENFNKIIWNNSSAYNKYKYPSTQSFTDMNSYLNDTSGAPVLTSAAASALNRSSATSPLWYQLPAIVNNGLKMYEIKDQNGKGTGLKIPESIFNSGDDKDKIGKYYVDLLQPYLQKWVIPYTMMIDSQDKDFIDKVMNEMYHRVDVDVFKLSKEVRTTKKSFYMKAISYDEVTDFLILRDGSRFTLGVSRTNEKKGLNTRDSKLGRGNTVQREIGNTENDASLPDFLRGKEIVRWTETTTVVELDPSNEPAIENGQPIVKEINVTRNISNYKSVPKVVNIESFYDIIRENFNIVSINENSAPNEVTPTSKSIDEGKGILTENYDETWYEELNQTSQTEKKSYSVSYYTEEQVENLGRRISRVEWAQDYGNPNEQTLPGGATGGDNGTIEVGEKVYKLYDQGSFSGNIPGAGCGLTSTCMVLSAYRTDLDLNPDGLASQIGWTEPRTIAATAADLESYGVKAEAKFWVDYADGYPGKKSTSYNEISENLKAQRPVIIQVKSPCPYTSGAHYMVLVAIDSDNMVTIADSAGGVKRVDSLSNMINYMYDGAVHENGYVLIKSDTKSSSNGKNDDNKKDDNKTDDEKKAEDIIKDENSKRITEMLKYGASLAGKVPYVYGGPMYHSKEDIINGTDCSGFAISLYDSFFNVELENNGLTRTDMYETCENVNINGLVGKKVFEGERDENGYLIGTNWNSEIESIVQPGDIIWTSGHISVYAGDIYGDGNLYILSQGYGMGPQVPLASSYTAIKGIARFVGDGAVLAGGSGSFGDNSRIYPSKTRSELLDAYSKYGDGKGYSYDDLYFAYNHIEQYYSEIDEVNGHKIDDSSNPYALGWPVDYKKYPGCEVINCFFGYTPAYGGTHRGVDISSGGHVTGSTLHIGPEVIAAHDGKVVLASADPVSDSDAYTCVEIETEDGNIRTQYGHLSKILVNNGDIVKKGDVIGRMGTTGESTGTHLHFVVFEGGNRVDPLNYYILAKEGSDEEVDYSTIDKNTITTLPTGYKFLKEKSSGSAALVDFIYFWEGSSPLSADGTKYQVMIDTIAGTRAVGHGIDLDAGGYASVFEAAGYSTTVGSYIDKDFCDALSLKEINTTFREPVIARTAGLNLTDFQIDALTSRAYNMGSEGALGSMYTSMDFATAYKTYWKNGDLKSSVDFNHPLYTNYMQYVTNGGVAGLIRRRKAEWRIFQTGNYEIVD